MKITAYEGICNLGVGISAIYQKAINGERGDYVLAENFSSKPVLIGVINCELPYINESRFNIRCNRLILKNLELLQNQITDLLHKYGKSKIGIICATTNSGVEEFEHTKNNKHYELGNSAEFLHNYLNLTGYYTTVSTACSSSTKAFSLARDLINNNVVEAVIIVCADTLAKLPIYGFYSLEVLSEQISNPFSKNRSGMNIGEASSIFIIEQDGPGIEILGLGESSDIYHITTPDPNGVEEINAIRLALKDAAIMPEDIDYINAHGTGTIANDLMEATAIHKVFGGKIPVSSTKPLTGHCLGSASGIETLLCCKLLDDFSGKLFPHIYDGEYDLGLPPIKLAEKNMIYPRCKTVLSNSFGFGGTNAIIVLRRG